MGATNIEFKLPKSKFPDTASLQKWYCDRVEDAIHEHGHDAYNGTISTTGGIRVSSSTFKTDEEASEYILEHTEKRGHILAVTVGNFWYIGGWAAE